MCALKPVVVKKFWDLINTKVLFERTNPQR